MQIVVVYIDKRTNKIHVDYHSDYKQIRNSQGYDNFEFLYDNICRSKKEFKKIKEKALTELGGYK